MAIKKLTYRVTATVTKDITVEVDEDELEEGQDIEDLGSQLANEQFSILNDDNDEKYTQDTKFIGEFVSIEEMTYEYLLYQNQKEFDERKAFKSVEGFNSMQEAMAAVSKVMKKGMVAKVQSYDREEIEIFTK